MASVTSIGIIVQAEIKKTNIQLLHDLEQLLCSEHKETQDCDHDYCDGIRMAINQIRMLING